MPKQKLLLGCSGEGLARRASIPEIFALLREAGFQSVDFWLYLYSLEPDQPMLQSGWQDWVRKLAALYRENGLAAAQIHGMLNIYIPEDFHTTTPGPASHRNLEASRMLGCERIVFHPAFYVGRVCTEDLRQRILDYNVRWFTPLMQTAKDCGVRIQLENTFDFAHVQQPGDPAWPFTTVEDLLYLADALGPQAEICLDTGHAHISRQDIPAMIRRFGPRLQSIHLNDNVGPLAEPCQDLHMFPGTGTIDWKLVFAALAETGYRGVLDLEPTGAMARAPECLWRSQLRTGLRDLRTLATEAGLETEATP